jgi:chromate transporter
MTARSPLSDLCWQLSLLSLVAIGGANSVIPEIYRLVVENRQIMSGREFSELYALAQAAPGPNVLIVALIGWKVAGIRGAGLALAAICVPPCLLTYSVSKLWDKHRGRPWLALFLTAVAPLSAGLVLSTGYLLSRGSSAHLGQVITFGATWVAFASRRSPLWILAAGAALGILGAQLR